MEFCDVGLKSGVDIVDFMRVGDHAGKKHTATEIWNFFAIECKAPERIGGLLADAQQLLLNEKFALTGSSALSLPPGACNEIWTVFRTKKAAEIGEIFALGADKTLEEIENYRSEIDRLMNKLPETL